MNLLRCVAPVIAVLVAATPALAQPGAEDVPPPPPDGGTIVTIQPESEQPPIRAVVAPMNESWSNVSHINGHPVEVGDRDKYLLTYRKTNVASNPIGWMFGFYGLSLSHAVSPNIAVRADGNLVRRDNIGGYEVGLTVPIYFKRVYEGPFLEGGLLVRDIHDNDREMAEAAIGPQAMFGWHWSFDSGANVAFAFGAFRPIGDDKSADDVQVSGYFRVGYAY
jgi:hypothetical protein